VEYVQSVRRVWTLARRYGFDALIVLLTLVAMLEAIVRSDRDTPKNAWFAIPALGIMVLPLLLARRRYPFAAPAFYWLAAVAISFVDGNVVSFSTSIFVLGICASFLLGNLRDPVAARTGLAVVVGGAVVVVWNVPVHTTGEQLFLPLLFGLCWLGGFVLRGQADEAQAAELRAAQAEREREAAARIAVAEERARIARELHDVVAHAVSVMVLQVGAVRHKLPATLEEDRDALRGVEHAGRTALTEMRRLLAAMRREGDGPELGPQAGLDDLDALLEEVGRAGLPVDLHVDGDPVPLPRGLELSAYRIVQEGLTNALKHARATAADVTVRYGLDELEIEVRDDGVGTSTSDGLGHGLVGIGERVKIYGGEMSAESANGGGFVLSARLPIRGDRR
jgi:signal transduction histidine kinase